MTAARFSLRTRPGCYADILENVSGTKKPHGGERLEALDFPVDRGKNRNVGDFCFRDDSAVIVVALRVMLQQLSRSVRDSLLGPSNLSFRKVIPNPFQVLLPFVLCRNSFSLGRNRWQDSQLWRVHEQSESFQVVARRRYDSGVRVEKCGQNIRVECDTNSRALRPSNQIICTGHRPARQPPSRAARAHPRTPDRT